MMQQTGWWQNVSSIMLRDRRVRIPLGTEIGCNEHWICGGYTEEMMPEGIAYNVKNPNIYLNNDFSKDIEVECLKSKK